MISNRAFLEALFADALPGTHTIICSFHGDPYKPPKSAWRGRPWVPGDCVSPWFDKGNTYTTVSTFEPDPQTGELRRRKANFASLHTVMVDDCGTKVPLGSLHLSPSALIETSPSNFQAFYFVVQDAEARDRDLCERLIDRMVAAGLAVNGKDPGMKGVTRYARLPVGVNGKSKYVKKLGRPFAVQCLEFHPERRYRISQIAAAWSLDMTPPPKRQLASVIPIDAARTRQSFAALIETLKLMQMYRGRIGSGPWHDIKCPWLEEHTDGADNGAAIADPSEHNNFAGGFRCHHSHGEDLSMRDIWRWVRELARGHREQA